MEDQWMNNKARSEDEDKISNLSDDVIHQIMSFLDTRIAVQTSILSKRWKLVWTTLPFLYFNEPVKGCQKEFNFVKHVFSNRNHQSQILNLDLYPTHGLSLGRTKRFVRYAIDHNVERLNVQPDEYCSLAVFNSKSLKELKLTMKFKPEEAMRSDCWNLPNLTTLICECTNYNINYRRKIYKLPESCLICLPALTNLCLSHCEFPDFISLPSLTTLHLESCQFPKTVWDFPALSTLELVKVFFPVKMSDYFLALASLRNLTIDFRSSYCGCCDISCSRLMNLKISSPLPFASNVKIVVQAPGLRNFEAVGFFQMTFEGFELENVNIKYWDRSMYNESHFWMMERLFKSMFSQLGSTKILSLDLMTLQALSEHSDILVDMDSPFYNLKYMKLPLGYEESSISSSVRQYLLGGSPSATFVKKLPQESGSGGVSLVGKTLAVMGLGKVDTEVARCAKGLGMHVIAHDPYALYAPTDRARTIGVELVSFDEALATADFISLHMPPTPSTSKFLNDENFAKMKKGVRIVNVARGGVIDEDALVKALDAGIVAQAALNVFTVEPPPKDSRLVQHENVTVTPHLGASTQEGVAIKIKIAKVFVGALKGKLAATAVNAPMVLPEVLTELNPYVVLADKLGRLAVQLVAGGSGVKSVKVTYASARAPDDLDTRLFRAMITKGIIEPISSVFVNWVDADFTAKQRGIRISEERILLDGSPESPLELIQVQIANVELKFASAISDSGEIKVEGRVKDGVPHLTKVGSFEVNVSLEGSIILCRQVDQPGVIGTVGSILGEANVNVSFMSVVRIAPRKQAVMAIGVDKQPSKESLKRIGEVPAVEEFVYLKL